MSILERIQADVRQSMRDRDTERSTALRMLVAALQDEAKTRQRELDDSEEIAVLSRERKKRVEAAEGFEKGGSSERAARERQQLQMIEQYLPSQLDQQQVDALVAEAIAQTGATSPREMGAVMKAVMPKIQGRADGKVVSASVQRQLAAAGGGS